MNNRTDAIDLQAISVTPARPGLSTGLAGLSDRTIAWLFIGPTIVLLLAINALQWWSSRNFRGAV